MVANGTDAALADVALSGLPGWVSVSAPLATGRISLRVWVPRGCEAFVRPPVPAGPGAHASHSQRTLAQAQEVPAPYEVSLPKRLCLQSSWRVPLASSCGLLHAYALGLPAC